MKFLAFLLFTINLVFAIRLDIPATQSHSYIKKYFQTNKTILYKITDEKTYSTARFTIHYGSDYPKTALWSDSNSNGIPDFVEKLAQYLEFVANKEVNELGFKQPYGGFPLNVYIANTGLVLGNEELTLPDNIAGYAAVYNGYTFMVINANLPSSPYTKPIDLLKVTLAHEFFHLIQYSYKISSNEADTWLYEGTAVLMESVVFPDIPDYVYEYAFEFIEHPNYGLVCSPNIYHPYSTVLFFDFLKNKFGLDFIKQIWENFTNTDSALEALIKTISQNGYSLAEILNDFYFSLKHNPNEFSNGDILKDFIKKLPTITNANSLVLDLCNTGAIYLKTQTYINLANLGENELFINDENETEHFLSKFLNDELLISIGNQTESHIAITLKDTNAYDVPLYGNWNLVSFKEEFNATTLDQFNIKIAWKWNSTSQNWEVYIPPQNEDLIKIAKKYGITFFSKLNPGEGVWILTNQEDVYEGILSEYGYDIKKANGKWVLAGNPILVKIPLNDLSKLLKFQIIWFWNATSQQWEVYVPDYEQQLKQLVEKYQIPILDYIPSQNSPGFWIKY